MGIASAIADAIAYIVLDLILHRKRKTSDANDAELEAIARKQAR